MLPLFDRAVRLPALLTEALTRGAVIVAANVRAARALTAAYNEDQPLDAQDDGPRVWPNPSILDWHSWVAELWDDLQLRAPESAAPPLPLTPLQEHELWRQVQGADRDLVVAPDRMADLARQAYALLSSYRAHPLRQQIAASSFGAPHKDVERFLDWAVRFDRSCQQNGWTSSTHLEEQLAGSMALLDLPLEVILVGFDRTTPAEAALLEAVEAQGTRVHRYAPADATEAPLPVLLAAEGLQEELESCARWCRSQLVHDSACRIGVIVPDLGRHRAEIERVFRRVLMPQTTLWADSDAGNADAALPFEFSLGAPLSYAPAVRAALLLLEWLHAPLATSELTWLLNSGFLAASAADQLALARLDAELRRQAEVSPRVALRWLLERSHQSRHLPAELRTRLTRVEARAAREGISSQSRKQGAASGVHRKRTWAYWAELVPSLLSEAGWPGYRTPDSFAYQAQQRWTRLLAELAELGFDGSQPVWSEFLATLRSHTHTVLFAAESESAPIQVLGAFESSGLTFDAVWFLGVDDQHWPAVGQPHPLLPAWLQREAGMPHTSPEADWQLAQEATERILASASGASRGGLAPRLVLSYARQEQGMELRSSPLLPSHITAASLPPQPAWNELADVALESVADDSGVVAWPLNESAGGAEILKRQAACAFQSFAVRRLQARPLEETEQGLGAAARGTLVHQVLERIWSSEPGDPMRLHSHDELVRAFANESVTAMVTYHVGAAFAARRRDGAAAHTEDAWHKAYYAVERERICTRLLDWLECERERQTFHVDAVEHSLGEISVGDLRLNLRADRIDLLADGSRLLLDYKTGKVAISAWDGERPEEPQLPLYALFSDVERVSGVAFGQIRADGTKLLVRAEDAPGMVSAEAKGQAGTAAEKNGFDDEVRARWRGSLLAIADQFASGDARVNPRDGGKTCQWCPLPGLCRVHASSVGGEEENDASTDRSSGASTLDA